MVNVLVFIAFFDNLAQQPIISPLAASLGAPTFLIGLIVGSYSLANISGNLFSPKLIVHHGLKVTLAIGIGGVAISLFLYSLVQNPTQLLLIRLLHGISGGIIVPCIFTYVSYTSKQDNKMSQVGRLIGLAALLGPPLAGLSTGAFGFATTFRILCLLFLIALGILKTLPDKQRGLRTNPQLREAIQQTKLRMAYAAAFALMFANGMLVFWFPLQITEIGLGVQFVGAFFTIFGLAAIAVMRWAAYHGNRNPIKIIGLGLLCISAAMVLLASTMELSLLGVAMVLYGLGFGCIFPSMNLLVIKETTDVTRASAFAVFHGFFSFGVFIGPTIGGWTHQWIHPFYFVVLVIILSFAIFGKAGFRHYRQQQLNMNPS